MENEGKRGAFDLAREALLARYGTLDPDRLRAAGADEVEIGAVVRIAERDGTGVVREKRFILACPPTNINELLAGQGMPQYVPTVDHTLTQCVECGTDMWIGSKQREAASRAPNATVALCLPCAVAETKRRGGAVVQHLGGGDGRPRLSS
ncbi:hypothetical protein [Micromonospora cathayae]|uniref:Amine oxidase domain-containing protein n=1 Tax=Micromonospora cathayae TaxID=3028804 RepID=A0ABY7ZP88_9ACTN|nr:hypothetical protein [Micromonospora sp. HUAS 3]WDZ84042.1 hypothetical protein PVK37_26810 [Micromonospora sp. HUAS 3]